MQTAKHQTVDHDPKATPGHRPRPGAAVAPAEQQDREEGSPPEFDPHIGDDAGRGAVRAVQPTVSRNASVPTPKLVAILGVPSTAAASSYWRARGISGSAGQQHDREAPPPPIVADGIGVEDRAGAVDELVAGRAVRRRSGHHPRRRSRSPGRSGLDEPRGRAAAARAPARRARSWSGAGAARASSTSRRRKATRAMKVGPRRAPSRPCISQGPANSRIQPQSTGTGRVRYGPRAGARARRWSGTAGPGRGRCRPTRRHTRDHRRPRSRRRWRACSRRRQGRSAREDRGARQPAPELVRWQPGQRRAAPPPERRRAERPGTG